MHPIKVEKVSTLVYACKAHKYELRHIELPFFYALLSETKQIAEAAAMYAANNRITK
jgi:hypothetical protein